MNWNDYIRGYDDGVEEYHNRNNHNNPLVTLLHFAFAMFALLLRLLWRILTSFLSLLVTMFKLLVGRRR